MTLKLLSLPLFLTRSAISAQRRYSSRGYRMEFRQKMPNNSNNDAASRPNPTGRQKVKSHTEAPNNVVASGSASASTEPQQSAGRARRKPARPGPGGPTTTSTAGGRAEMLPSTAAIAEPAARTEGASTKPKRTKRPRAERLRAQEAHLHVVLDAARSVIQILQPHGLSCAVFGSLASKLYGCSRMPKDVDMIVTQTSPASSHRRSNSQELPPQPSAHKIKELLVQTNPRNFYLRMPRDPTAPYRILWYRRHFRGPECKVDVLIPGDMHLPSLRPANVTWKDQIPLVPFPVLLYHKLQGWSDHVSAEEEHKRRKQTQDAGDVRKLLSLVQEMGRLQKMPLGGLEDKSLFSEEFRKLTVDRVKAFCVAFGDKSGMWKSLGFEVPDEVPEQQLGLGGRGLVIDDDGDAEVGSEGEERTGLVEEDEDDGVVVNNNDTGGPNGLPSLFHGVDLLSIAIVDRSPVVDAPAAGAA